MNNTEHDTSTDRQSFQFQTEIKQILQLLIHSLYTKREIFLRELISNASDALNKVQFEQLTRKEIVSPDAELSVRIEFSDENKTLTIHDTGIGMSRQELIDNLGTIAKSGSKAFLEKLKDSRAESGAGVDLIGQFGVGFYSAFMVAERVSVTSRSYHPEETAWTWESTGEGDFSVEPADRSERGTSVTLHMRDDATDILSKWRIEDIVKTYSNFVSFPIYVDNNVANRRKAIWAQAKSEITPEMYEEFYGHLAHATRKPQAHLHIQAEGNIQFNAIVYIPHEAPMWYSPLEREHGLQLYVKRVFIQDNCAELIPRYLRFLKGVADVDDLPLNVSREVIQKNPIIDKVESNIVRKTLQLFQEIGEKEPEKYTQLWRDFGIFLKEGVREDFKNKELLADLLRYNSSMHADDKGLTSLKEYVERMPEGQGEIYYFSGTSRDAILRSPHLDALKKKNFEVLFMTETIDPLVVMSLGTYKEKKFRIIDDPELKLETEPTPESDAKVTDLVDFIKQVLGDRVESVRVSSRLVESPCCLVNSDKSMGSDMQRLYSMMDKDFKAAKKVLEINSRHPITANLAAKFETVVGDPTGQETLRPFVENLFGLALLAEGLHPNPSDLVPGITQLLTMATGTLSAATSAS